MEGIAVHDHFGSTTDAYDETQCNEAIRSGDVLVIESEGVVGILDEAWPCAVTVAHGELHTWNISGHLVRDGAYRAGLAAALDKARELGFPVNPLHAPVITSAAPEPESAPEPVSEDAYYDSLCPWCEGYGFIEIFHPSTDALIGSRRCDNKPYHKVSLVKRTPEWASKVPECACGNSGWSECCPPF